MSTIRKDFDPVSKKNPCPVCGHNGWCMVSKDNPADPSRVLCQRVKSERKWGKAGYLHDLKLHIRERSPKRHAFSIVVPSPKFAQIATLAHATITDECLNGLADRLGVSANSLSRLRIGWMSEQEINAQGTRSRSSAWTTPMTNETGAIVGIRIRTTDGAKFALKGSQNGIFVPEMIQMFPRRVIVTEGESDAAAMLTLGFEAFGIPGVDNCTSIVAGHLRRIRPEEVVVLGDGDPPGRAGAERLAGRLSADHPVVRLCFPPAGVKDALLWKKAGATSADIEAAILASAPVVCGVRKES